MIKKIWNKFIAFMKWIWAQLKDWRTLVIFIAVLAVMYFPAYGFYIFSVVFSNLWLAGIATAYVAFWAGPFTPFFPLCIAITLGIKKLMYKISAKRSGNGGKKDGKGEKE